MFIEQDLYHVTAVIDRRPEQEITSEVEQEAPVVSAPQNQAVSEPAEESLEPSEQEPSPQEETEATEELTQDPESQENASIQQAETAEDAEAILTSESGPERISQMEEKTRDYPSERATERAADEQQYQPDESLEAAPRQAEAKLAAEDMLSSWIVPVYPKDAANENIEGNVHLRIRVSEVGQVEASEVVESSGDARLDEQARKTMEKRWEFKAHQFPYEMAVRVSYSIGSVDVDFGETQTLE